MNPGLLKKILIVLIFLFFASLLIKEVSALTQDLGRHLKLGEIIFETKSIPKTNLFSYTEPDHPFINTHWFSEVIFYFIFKLFSFSGLIIFSAFIMSLSFIIAFFAACRKNYFWPGFLSSLWAVGILMERTDIRPEIFSFLFFAAYFYILFKNLKLETTNKFLWLLPLLQLFWTNLHIYFFLGPVLYSFFFLETLFRKRSDSFAAFLKSAEFRKLIAIGVLIGIAILINPGGIKGALYPLNAMKEYGYSIVENQTPFFLSGFNYHQTILFFFFVAVIALFLSLILNFSNFWRERKIFNFLSAVFVSFFGFYAIRDFPIFALAFIPLFTENISMFYSRFDFKKFSDELFPGENRFFPGGGQLARFGKPLAIIFIAFLIFGIFSNARKFSLAVPDGAKKAVDFIIENNISGKMFNNYDIGGYLIWRLWPQKKVFVDNRPEAYSVEFLQSIYIPMQENEGAWQKYAKEYDFNFIIFERTDITPWARTFLNRIIGDKNWPMVYSDERAFVFVKRAEINKEIINKYSSQKYE